MVPIDTDTTPLTRVDSPLVPYDELTTSLNMWLSTMVDTINSDIDRLESVFLSLDARLTAIGA